MKAPTKIFFGHTWVGWLNLLLVRWFFIRLAYVQDGAVFKGWAILYGVYPFKWKGAWPPETTKNLLKLGWSDESKK